MSEARKQQKRLAKQQRQLIFRLGSRALFWLETFRRCLCLLCILVMAWTTYISLATLFAAFSTFLRCLQALYFICIIVLRTVLLGADLCILHFLLQMPIVRDVLAGLRYKYQHFVLVVVVVASDSVRGLFLFVLWLCDFHLGTSSACECFSMLVYVAATVGSHSSVSSVFLFAMLGRLFPAFPPKRVPSQVLKKPSGAMVLKTPSGAASLEVSVFEIKYCTGNKEKRYSFASYYFTSDSVIQRANELKTFLMNTQLFQNGYWPHTQFDSDVMEPLKLLLFDQYRPGDLVFTVRRRVCSNHRFCRIQSGQLGRHNYFKVSVCIDDLLFKVSEEASHDELKQLALKPQSSSLYAASEWAADPVSESSEAPLFLYGIVLVRRRNCIRFKGKE